MSNIISLNQPRARRRFRIGGYRIGNDAATQWGSQLTRENLDPDLDSPTVRMAVLKKVYSFGINFRQVGEVADVHWMLITQEARFDGHSDMDPAEIPQFEPGELDMRAEKLLKEAGIKEYEFATVLD